MLVTTMTAGVVADSMLCASCLSAVNSQVSQPEKYKVGILMFITAKETER